MPKQQWSPKNRRYFQIGFDKYSNKPVSTSKMVGVNLTYAVILGHPLGWLVVNYLKKTIFPSKIQTTKPLPNKYFTCKV